MAEFSTLERGEVCTGEERVEAVRERIEMREGILFMVE